IVLHGNGDNFCAGIDTSIFDPNFPRKFADSMKPQPGSHANLFQRAACVWREIPVPVICAIKGVAFGGGFQIALGADMRYSTPEAKFSVMEVKWGLIPDMGISTTARHIIAPDRLKELAFSGRIFNGEDALSMGVVTSLHPDPYAAAMLTATEIAGRSPDAIRGMKRLFNSGFDLDDAAALALEARIQSGLMGRPNQVEAVAANLEKRPPEFDD
ncbi:MAG: enoyl-CoA hydratase, partial [Woeseiaceae bacterium]|nr:enoyl-CoA hydratase [Woeseiaceae bacterium]